jgi:hypothetical protein
VVVQTPCNRSISAAETGRWRAAPDNQTIRGTGPPIAGDVARVAPDFANQVAFLTVFDNALMRVDLVTGDRVITSR